MVLFQLVNLSEKIEEQRKTMHELAEKNGIRDSIVLTYSQQLDESIVSYQRLLKLVSKYLDH